MLELFVLNTANVDDSWHVLGVMLPRGFEHFQRVLDSVLVLVDQTHVHHGVGVHRVELE